MANISLADQLDDAIEMMIAEPDSAPPRVDLKIGELLGIAAELRLLPDPAFRAALKAELLGQSTVTTTPTMMERRSARNREEAILPTLFGAGYGNYPLRRGNVAISMAVHAALLAIVAASRLWLADGAEVRPQVISILRTDISPIRVSSSPGKNGGGGQHERQPDSPGSLPRFTHQQLTPPTIVVPREAPKLAVDMTLLGPPELSETQTSQIGNPLSEIIGPPSNGSGTGGGIGTGRGGGIGGGTGAYRVGGGVSAPFAIFDPEPEYSDEARQAKYQGTVMLWVVVGTDGRPREIRVQRSLGMGLDEKAVAAVRGWKFRPGMKDGVPVAVQVNIEVVFRLL
jgi:periplasmic protein TonB